MRELTHDPFYELINKQYDRCVIDYCLIAPDFPYRGIRSHREAVLFAMLKIIERYLEDQRASEEKFAEGIRDDFFPWNLDFGKARAHRAAPVDPHLLEPHDAAVAVVGRRRLPYAAARVAPARHLGATRYHGPVPRANPLDRGTGLAGVLRPEFKRTPQRVVPRGDLDAPGRLVAAGPGGANSLKRLLRRKPFGRNAHYPHRAFANAACGCRGKQGGKDESACISHLRATPPSVRMHGES